VRAATWLAAESAALRMSRDPEYEALGAAATVTLAIGTINREHLRTSDLSTEMLKQAQNEGAISFGHITSRPFRIDGDGQSGSADNIIEVAVDAAESWLFNAYNGKPGGSAQVAGDLSKIAARAMRRYSIQHGLNDLWNQGCWEGWRLFMKDGKPVWAASDTELATRLEASRVRQAENFMNYPFIDMASWARLSPEERKRRLPRTVTKVSAGKLRKIRVGKPACLSRQPPAFLLDRAGLEGSYLGFLLDREFPENNRFTCRFLLQAWHAIVDLALALARPHRQREIHSLEDAQSLALLVWRRELVDVLMRALMVDQSTADAVIMFLTFGPRSGGDKGHRGLWAAPLVPIPDEDRFALALPALVMSNPLRRTEAWLEKGWNRR
jgi:hypothetical protein